MGVKQVSQNRRDYVAIPTDDAKHIPVNELYVLNYRGGILPVLPYLYPTFQLLRIKEVEDGD